MDLELREGSRLYSADGEDLGVAREFVVEPSSGEVTHVLVENGVFFTDDRVVPIETIDHAEDDEIVLSEAVDPATLPQFVREHFTLIDDETRTRLDVPSGYIWRYPTTYAGPFPIYPAYPIRRELQLVARSAIRGPARRSPSRRSSGRALPSSPPMGRRSARYPRCR